MWWLGTVEDVFHNYELDGLQWGAECVGPLSNLMFNGTVPYCFCEHCRARGKQEGIDVERARRAKERAEQRLQQKSADFEMARAEASLQRALARLKVADYALAKR